MNDSALTRRLFLASAISLVTTSMVFAIRGDVADAMASEFRLDAQQLGLIFSPAFWAFTIAIFVSAALVDFVGMRRLHLLSAIGYFAGIALVLLAPRPSSDVHSIFEHRGTTMLYAGFMVMGLSQGLVEGVINPLIATLYPTEKTRRLNLLHAWWPGGLIIGGLVAVALSSLFAASWELKLATILIPAAIYFTMSLTMSYPQTERVRSRLPASAMWKETSRPLFILLFFVMWLTAAIELGPDQWFPSVMGALVPQMQGVVYLVYTAGLVFLLRTFGSGLAHRAPVLTLLVCSALAGAGLYWLGALEPGVSGAFTAFLAATVFGVGKAFLWPTMLGVTAEQFPKGGALALGLMGGAGMLSVAVALPVMGAQIDHHGPGAALQMMAMIGMILVVFFLALQLWFASRGGYRPARLE